ncbi:multicopper oxidase domain-containing protein [Streptomyces olivoreticuli]
MTVRQGQSRRRFMGWAAATLGGGALAAGHAPVRAVPRLGPDAPVTRVYYIAADTVTWDYAPQARSLISGKSFTTEESLLTRPGLNRLGSVFHKSQYREYTDATFTKLARRPGEAYMGLLGPVIRAHVGDTIRVVFKNNTPFKASMHPHGVFYTTSDEGASVNDGTTDSGRDGGIVDPGKTHTYVWQVPERAGPGPRDPSSIGWLYHDHSVMMGVPGTNAGLIGPMVVTRRCSASHCTTPKDVDREVFALFTQFDENVSPYLEQNTDRFGAGQEIDATDTTFLSSNRKPCVNGYLFGNGPAGTTDSRPSITIDRDTRVRWYCIGLGGARDIHTPHWHGNTVLVRGHRTDVVTVLPATVVTADMRPDNPGTWLFHCHIDEHMMNGMVSRYLVR